MKRNNNNKITQSHLGDHIIMCDQCGMPCWFSEATLLDNYTGKGGLLVCPDDVDKIHYGLVPYRIPPEKTPNVTRNNSMMDSTNITNTNAPMTDFSGVYEGFANPQWQNLLVYTWDQWFTKWNS